MREGPELDALRLRLALQDLCGDVPLSLIAKAWDKPKEIPRHKWFSEHKRCKPRNLRKQKSKRPNPWWWQMRVDRMLTVSAEDVANRALSSTWWLQARRIANGLLR